MRKLLDILSFVFISPEVLLAAGALFFVYFFPSVITFFSEFLVKKDTASAFLVFGIPLVLLAGIYKFGFAILNPTEHKKALKDWTDYWMVKYRINYSLILGACAFVATIAAYFLVNTGSSFLGASITAISWAIEAGAACSVAYAHIEINDALHSGASS